MSRAYVTRDGETLDAIAWRAYGSEAAVHALIGANPNASMVPERLPAGVVLILPDITPAPAGDVKTVRLWAES